MGYPARLAAIAMRQDEHPDVQNTDLPACLANSSPMMMSGFLLPAVCLPVGASLLAKIVNDNAGLLDERCALGFFASKLAPTVSETVSGKGLEQLVDGLQITRFALLAPIQGDHLLVSLDLVDVAWQCRKMRQQLLIDAHLTPLV